MARDGPRLERDIETARERLCGRLGGADVGPAPTTFMPMKPAAPDSTAPIRNPTATDQLSSRPRMMKMTTPTMAMVRYCRRR